MPSTTSLMILCGSPYNYFERPALLAYSQFAENKNWKLSWLLSLFAETNYPTPKIKERKIFLAYSL